MKGSALRMCDWASDHPAKLESYFPNWPSFDAFRSGELLEWLCPLKTRRNCAEVRDGLWKLAKLSGPTPQESNFWPKVGPQWDGVASVPGKNGRRGILLVEAKSHAGELKSSPTGAEGKRLELIQESLGKVKERLGVPLDTEWAKRYYQITNRLAFLFYMREHEIPAWLLFVYFKGDYFEGGKTKRFFPTSEKQWRPLIAKAKSDLALPEHHWLSAFTHDAFIPATLG